jgi:NADH-quinone oxidoreductase subunit M
MQRVYLGPEYRGPHPEALIEANARELVVGYTLVACAILFGVFPNLLFTPMTPSINALTESLASAYEALYGAAAAVQTTQLP